MKSMSSFDSMDVLNITPIYSILYLGVIRMGKFENAVYIFSVCMFNS